MTTRRQATPTLSLLTTAQAITLDRDLKEALATSSNAGDELVIKRWHANH